MFDDEVESRDDGEHVAGDLLDYPTEHAVDGAGPFLEPVTPGRGCARPPLWRMAIRGAVVVLWTCTEIQGLSEEMSAVVGKADAYRTGDASHREEALRVWAALHGLLQGPLL